MDPPARSAVPVLPWMQSNGSATPEFPMASPLGSAVIEGTTCDADDAAGRHTPSTSSIAMTGEWKQPSDGGLATLKLDLAGCSTPTATQCVRNPLDLHSSRFDVVDDKALPGDAQFGLLEQADNARMSHYAQSGVTPRACRRPPADSASPLRLSAGRLATASATSSSGTAGVPAGTQGRRGSSSSASRPEPKGDVALCIRLRPVDKHCPEDMHCAVVEAGNSVRLKPSTQRTELTETVFRCDHAFGPEADQEQVYNQAVAPIIDSVIRGYNGAVIAYGQTGSGKTHTMIGSSKGKGQGVAPRAVSDVFTVLNRLTGWYVEVSVLEIYNERVRDLLAQGNGVSTVDIHEVSTDDQSISFQCPDATTWRVSTPQDALAVLAEGVRRRETARTDMNHHSSRSHLIFTLCIAQTDHEAGATLRSRLHFVDLAGSERLKRSMTSESPRGSLPRGNSGGAPRLGAGARVPRDQRREAGDINKSLSQLALVIQRLTTPGAHLYVPYRDSMLTRLLAESFGGSSKTCLIVACSGSWENREETRSSLEFGKRAKLVRNKATINIEVQNEPSTVMKALLMRELTQMQAERDAFQREREDLLDERNLILEREAKAQRLLEEAATKLNIQQDEHEEQVKNLEVERQTEREELEDKLQREEAAAAAERDASARQVDKLEDEKADLEGKFQSASADLSELAEQHAVQRKTLQDLDRQHSDFKQRCEADAEEQVRLLEDNSNQITALQERGAMFERSEQEVAARLLLVQAEKARAYSTFEEQNSALHKQRADDISQLHCEMSAATARHEKDQAVLRTELSKAVDNAAQLSEERAAAARNQEDKITTACRRLHDELISMHEDKALAVATLEDEKVALHRQWQDEVTKLQEGKAAVVSELEQEKDALRRKLQDAMEEARRIQGHHAVLEAKFEQEQGALQEKLEMERSAAKTRWRDELSAVLEDKATEVQRLHLEQVQLHRKMSEGMQRLQEEQGQMQSRFEAENSRLHQNWQEAAAQVLSLQEAQASLSATRCDDLEQARKRWQSEISQQFVLIREENASTLGNLESRIAMADQRRQEAVMRASEMEEESNKLRQQLQKAQMHRLRMRHAEMPAEMPAQMPAQDNQPAQARPQQDPIGQSTTTVYQAGSEDLIGQSVRTVWDHASSEDVIGQSTQTVYQARSEDAIGQSTQTVYQARSEDIIGQSIQTVYQAISEDKLGQSTQTVYQARSEDLIGQSTQTLDPAFCTNARDGCLSTSTIGDGRATGSSTKACSAEGSTATLLKEDSPGKEQDNDPVQSTLVQVAAKLRSKEKLIEALSPCSEETAEDLAEEPLLLDCGPALTLAPALAPAPATRITDVQSAQTSPLSTATRSPTSPDHYTSGGATTVAPLLPPKATLNCWGQLWAPPTPPSSSSPTASPFGGLRKGPSRNSTGSGQETPRRIALDLTQARKVVQGNRAVGVWDAT